MISLAFIEKMKHSPVRNYAIPGLTSWLVGAPTEHGCIRLFESSREHHEQITPHSHRFDFECVVLAGEVRNVVWISTSQHMGADMFMETRLEYRGGIGHYEKEVIGTDYYRASEKKYATGDRYSMTADQIHSIYFSRGAKVLFFEGPKVSTSSIILEPYVDGEIVPTFKVEDWMFKRAAISTPNKGESKELKNEQ